MRIFFSVGEPSGDVHGANLVRELQRQHPDWEFVGFGGPKMAAAGCQLLTDLTQLAVMFLWSVIKNYFRFRRLLNEAEAYFRTHRVDAVVLIDYPGFNWHIARRAKRQGIPVFYYGVPQMWAWAPWRIKKLKRSVDHVLCKLPFEPQWFQQRGVKAQWIGHPFFDDLQQRQLQTPLIEQLQSVSGQTLLLLPGSRDSEVTQHWPWLQEAAQILLKTIPDARIVVGCFKDQHLTWVERQLRELPAAVAERFQVFSGQTPELMNAADACLACSGSVSLELLYYRLPTVIVYRLSRWKHWVQQYLIQARYITLVNLMAADSIARSESRAYDPDAPQAEPVPMPEYLTWRNPSVAIAKRLAEWLQHDHLRQQNQRWLDRLAREHAIPGATVAAARYIADCLREETTAPQLTAEDAELSSAQPRTAAA